MRLYRDADVDFSQDNNHPLFDLFDHFDFVVLQTERRMTTMNGDIRRRNEKHDRERETERGKKKGEDGQVRKKEKDKIPK